MTKLTEINEAKNLFLKELSTLYGWEFSPEELETIEVFLNKVGGDFLKTSMKIARKKSDRKSRWLIFCSLCWKRIRKAKF